MDFLSLFWPISRLCAGSIYLLFLVYTWGTGPGLCLSSAISLWITPNPCLASFLLTGVVHQYLRAKPLRNGSSGGNQVVFLAGAQTLYVCCGPCGLRVWGFPKSQIVPKGSSICTYTLSQFRPCSQMSSSTLLPQPEPPATMGPGRRCHTRGKLELQALNNAAVSPSL